MSSKKQPSFKQTIGYCLLGTGLGGLGIHAFRATTDRPWEGVEMTVSAIIFVMGVLMVRHSTNRAKQNNA